jgi:hypothetical protein
MANVPFIVGWFLRPDQAATFVLDSLIYFLTVDRDFLRCGDGQADSIRAYVHDLQHNIAANHNPFARFSA